MIILDWLNNQFRDFNFLTMVIVPIIVSIVPSIIGVKIVRHRSYVAELRQRVITINDKAQVKFLPHKARRDELASMGHSSVLDCYQRRVTGLQQIIDSTNRILLDLNRKQKIRCLKRIEKEINALEVSYGEIPL